MAILAGYLAIVLDAKVSPDKGSSKKGNYNAG
jgi:hypothetical protein